MAVDFSTAVNAYRQAAGAVGSGKPTMPAAEESGEGSFASMVSDTLKQMDGNTSPKAKALRQLIHKELKAFV